MKGLGDRMRVRARELGIPDAEVARRAGLTQQRYSNYVSDRHEPDLETFARLCAALQVSADSLLGDPVFVPPPPELETALTKLDSEAMTALALIAEALALRVASSPARLPTTHPPRET